VVAGFAVFVLVVVGFVAYGWWDNQVGPPHSKALRVGDTTLNLDFFSRRVKGFLVEYGLASSGQRIDQSTMLSYVNYMAAVLEQEILLRQRAPVDLELTVTPDEVEGEIASRLGVSPDDPVAFQAAYKEELKTKDLSDKEYREMIEANILATKVSDGFVRAAPEAADQVRLRLIQVGAQEDADKVVERLNAGEDFATVAKEMSSDTATKDDGGEKGWVTIEELDPSYAAKAFALDVGQRSEPLEGEGGFVIIEVEEKQAGRPLESEQRTTVGSRYFTLWMDEQRTLLPTTSYVSSDADKFQWVANHAT
jgi:parvulin-like peptidyl-prolyl isomerase